MEDPAWSHLEKMYELLCCLIMCCSPPPPNQADKDKDKDKEPPPVCFFIILFSLCIVLAHFETDSMQTVHAQDPEYLRRCRKALDLSFISSMVEALRSQDERERKYLSDMLFAIFARFPDLRNTLRTAIGNALQRYAVCLGFFWPLCYLVSSLVCLVNRFVVETDSQTDLLAGTLINDLLTSNSFFRLFIAFVACLHCSNLVRVSVV